MKEQKQPKKRYRKYDSVFKSDAVSQIKGGRSVKELSELLGVSESLLYKWKSEGTGRTRDQSLEVKHLKRELKRILEENDILKKALSIFSQSG